MNTQLLKIEPNWKDCIPMCDDACQSRRIKEQHTIGSNGCYAWFRLTGNKSPCKPEVCAPAIMELKAKIIKQEDIIKLISTHIKLISTHIKFNLIEN